MTFRSLRQLLRAPAYQQLLRDAEAAKRLQQAWQDSAGPNASATRPIEVRGDTLWVAAAGPALAQELLFRRQHILAKLNAHPDVRLPEEIRELRFSIARWYNPKGERSPNAFPSRAADRASSPDRELLSRNPLSPRLARDRAADDRLARNPGRPSPLDAKAGFDRWAAGVRQRSRNLPLCPRCQAPTPAAEIERWSVCAPCNALEKSFASDFNGERE